MRKLSWILLIAYFVSGCANVPTKYHPYDKTGGYSDAKIDENISTSQFSGNAYTPKEIASFYSKLRAEEVCKEQGFIGARVFNQADLTTSQTVLKSQTKTNHAPQTYSGTSSTSGNASCYGGSCNGSSNSNYSGTLSGGGSTSNTTVWNETYYYPQIVTFYRCSNEMYRTGVDAKNVSIEDMKPYVQDLMGAIQVTDVLDGSPNMSLLSVGDFITKVNGHRIQFNTQYIAEVESAKDKNHIELAVIREGAAKKVIAKAEPQNDWFKGDSAYTIALACSKVPEFKTKPYCNNAQNIAKNESWFFVGKKEDLERSSYIKSSSYVVHSGEVFGFRAMFPASGKQLNMKVTLQVPESANRFPAHEGKVQIADDNKSIVVENTIDGSQGSTAYYWGIAPGDPRGDYTLSFSIDGVEDSSYHFTVK